MAVAMLAVAGLLALTVAPAQAAADYDAMMQTILSKSNATYSEQLKKSPIMYPHYRYDCKGMAFQSVWSNGTRQIL